MDSKETTAASRRRRWAVAALVALLVGALTLVALRLALRELPAQVARALGPRASVEQIELGWTGVQVRGLVLKGASGRWPAAHELRAERVTIRPALASLWREGWTIGALTVENATLVLLRTRDGRIVATPSLLERATGDAGAKPDTRLRIDLLLLRDVVLELHDASVVARGAAPHRVRLTGVHGEVGPLVLPALDEAMTIDLQAAFDGPRRDGRVKLAGRLTPATREADLKLDAKGLELVALQPYLLRSGEARVAAGTLNLALHARAQQQRLHAPGRIVLRGLELQSGGLLGTFAGVPRQAVLAAMSRDGAIDLAFTLEGRVDDPTFSLNVLFAARFAFGLAEKLGVTLGGVVEGVGSVLKGLLGR